MKCINENRKDLDIYFRTFALLSGVYIKQL